LISKQLLDSNLELSTRVTLVSRHSPTTLYPVVSQLLSLHNGMDIIIYVYRTGVDSSI